MGQLHNPLPRAGTIPKRLFHFAGKELPILGLNSQQSNNTANDSTIRKTIKIAVEGDISAIRIGIRQKINLVVSK